MRIIAHIFGTLSLLGSGLAFMGAMLLRTTDFVLLNLLLLSAILLGVTAFWAIVDVLLRILVELQRS